MKKRIFKFLIIFIFTFPILLFMHTGFLTDSTVKLSQTVIFATGLSMIAAWPILRRFVLLGSLFLIVVMAVLYIVNMIEWADIIGSTGIGLIMINLLSYLPQLVKLGYIKKL